MFLALAAVISTQFCTAASAQPFRAALVDEAPSDPAFFNYREALLKAVEQRDVNYVVQQVANDIQLGFGGINGPEAMRAFLTVDPIFLATDLQKLAPEIRERNWNALQSTLELGGRFEDGNTVFVAPYTWTAIVPEKADPFETFFVIGDGVALRDQPNLQGRVLTRLDYDIVTMLDYDDEETFPKIKLSHGQIGFAHRDYLRALVGHRAFFSQVAGQWKMTVFVAGD